MIDDHDNFADTAVPEPARSESPGIVNPTLGDDTTSSTHARLGRYQLERRLGVGGMGEVHVARHLDTDQRVALKTLSRTSATNLYRFKREFRALADVTHPNLVRLFELGITDGGRAFFTMELLVGESFVDWVRGPIEPGALPNIKRLTNALSQLVDGVNALHERDCIHRDLKPSNVLVTGEGRVVLLDFGLVSELEEVERGITHDGQMLGTPAYMAPEQASGRRVGPAADYYAVGVMLYECLTGEKPHPGWVFRLQRNEPPSVDVSAPLTKAPRRLRELCRALLEFEPALRPTAEAILTQLDPHAPRTPTPQIEGKREIFVGRAKELALLHQIYRQSRSADAPTIVHLYGRSGQGKSTLLRQFRRQLEDDRCLILHGRCRERETVPYKGVDAVVDALSVYLRRLPEHELSALRPRAVDALVRVFPVLDELWSNAAPHHLGPSEQRSVSSAALRELLLAVVQRRPLIVHIDDFQWSDADSVQLLHELLRPPAPPRLLLVLALRDDVGDPQIRRKLDDSAVLAATALRIELGPLSQADALELASALARSDSGDELGRLTRRAESAALRSGGNPFYIGQLLRGVDTPAADMDIDAVVARGLRELEGPARCLLEIVAVAGRPLSTELALELCPAASLADIECLRKQALLVGEIGPSERAKARLETAHDRIREVALRELSTAEQAALHRALGQRLLARDGGLYDIVDHLNWTIEDEEDPARLWELAALDLRAGQAGLRASAPSLATSYLEAGLRAVARARDRDRDRDRDGHGPTAEHTERQALARALGVQYARCVSLLGDYERASTLFDALMISPLEPLEYANMALIRLESCTIAERQDDAVHWALAGLEQLGMRLSRSPGFYRVGVSLLRLKWAFRRNNLEFFQRLPPCTDPAAQLRMELLTKVVGPAYVVGGSLVPVVVVLAALESARNGRTPSFSFCLALVCMLLAGIMADYHGAAALADHSLSLTHEPHATRKAITVLLANSVSLHWTRPYADCLSGVDSSLELAMEEGDLEYATYAMLHRVGYQSSLGHALDVVRMTAKAAAQFAGDTGMTEFAGAIRVRIGMSEALAGDAALAELDPSAFDLLYPRCVAVLWTMQPLIFLGHPERALDLAQTIADKVEEGLFGFYLYPEYVFYRGLAAAMALDTATTGRLGLWRIFRSCRRKLDTWTRVYAGNLGAHAQLLAAERARLRGRTELAQSLYESAAREAGDQFQHIAALAWERLGRFMASRGWDGLAQAPMMHARELYERWGAQAKVALLDRDFPRERSLMGDR